MRLVTFQRRLELLNGRCLRVELLPRHRVLLDEEASPTAGRRFTVKAKLTRKARKALRSRSSVAFTLKATATDAAGNTSTTNKKAKVRRRR